MTAKRKDNGDLEVIHLGKYTFTFRTAMILLLVSLTPIGNRVWLVLGLDNATLGDTKLMSKFEAVDQRVDKLEKQLSEIQADVGMVNRKVTGFLIDFDKYKKQP